MQNLEAQLDQVWMQRGQIDEQAETLLRIHLRRKLFLLNDDQAMLDINEIPINILKRPSAFKLAFQQKHQKEPKLNEGSQEKSFKKYATSKQVSFKQAKKMKFEPPDRRKTHFVAHPQSLQASQKSKIEKLKVSITLVTECLAGK